MSDVEPASFVDAPPVQSTPGSNIIAYPSVASVPIVDPKQSRARKHRRRLALFIKLETIALFFLVLSLSGATSKIIRDAGFTLPFQIGMIASAFVVTIIPVIFFGLPRQKYRYRARSA